MSSEAARCFLNGATVEQILQNLSTEDGAQQLRDTADIVAESLLNSLELLASSCGVDTGFREIIGALKQGHAEGNADTIRNRAKEAREYLRKSKQ